MKRIVISLVIFFTFMSLFIGSFIGYLMMGQRHVLLETIEAIEITDLNDGVYQGTYTYRRWTNSLEITIEDGNIISIEVIEDLRFNDPLLQTILFERIKRATNLEDVDVVNGGTVSSIAYLKAIEDALKP